MILNLIRLLQTNIYMDYFVVFSKMLSFVNKHVSVGIILYTLIKPDSNPTKA